MQITREENGKLAAFAWPGGYEIHYVTADGGTLCYQCANGENGSRAADSLDAADPSDDQWRPVACDIHWEEEPDSPLHCDHCSRRIEPEYGIIEPETANS